MIVDTLMTGPFEPYNRYCRTPMPNKTQYNSKIAPETPGRSKPTIAQNKPKIAQNGPKISENRVKISKTYLDFFDCCLLFELAPEKKVF